MKLYYSPGSCALGIHVLMEEIGAPFEIARVNFAAREQYGDAYRAISPKSKVPALMRDDGTVLTEYQAISLFLGLTHPEKRLIPLDAERQVRMMEALEYIVGTIHAGGFRRVFRAGNFAPNEADHAAVRAEGVQDRHRGSGLDRQGSCRQGLDRRRLLDRRPSALLRLPLGGGPPPGPLAGECREALRPHDGPPVGQEGHDG
jgi:glutathione S-transferase